MCCVICLVVQLCLSVCNPMDCSPPGSSVCGNSPGNSTRVGCHALLPTQWSYPGLPYCRWILYHLSHQGRPWILEWVAYPFSRGTSWPRNRTGVSCIAGRFFTSWATWEAPDYMTRSLPVLQAGSLPAELPGRPQITWPEVKLSFAFLCIFYVRLLFVDMMSEAL